MKGQKREKRRAAWIRLLRTVVSAVFISLLPSTVAAAVVTDVPAAADRIVLDAQAAEQAPAAG